MMIVMIIDYNDEDIDQADALPVVRIIRVLFIEGQQADLALLQRLRELALDHVGHGEDGHKLGKELFLFVLFGNFLMFFFGLFGFFFIGAEKIVANCEVPILLRQKTWF